MANFTSNQLLSPAQCKYRSIRKYNCSREFYNTGSYGKLIIYRWKKAKEFENICSCKKSICFIKFLLVANTVSFLQRDWVNLRKVTFWHSTKTQSKANKQKKFMSLPQSNQIGQKETFESIFNWVNNICTSNMHICRYRLCWINFFLLDLRRSILNQVLHLTVITYSVPISLQ